MELAAVLPSVIPTPVKAIAMIATDVMGRLGTNFVKVCPDDKLDSELPYSVKYC